MIREQRREVTGNNCTLEGNSLDSKNTGAANERQKADVECTRLVKDSTCIFTNKCFKTELAMQGGEGGVEEVTSDHFSAVLGMR